MKFPLSHKKVLFCLFLQSREKTKKRLGKFVLFTAGVISLKSFPLLFLSRKRREGEKRGESGAGRRQNILLTRKQARIFPYFLFFLSSPFSLRRSRQVLELWESSFFVVVMGGEQFDSCLFTAQYFGFINSLWDGIWNSTQPFSSCLTLVLWILFGVGSGTQDWVVTWSLGWKGDFPEKCFTIISSPPQVIQQSLFLFSFETRDGF